MVPPTCLTQPTWKWSDFLKGKEGILDPSQAMPREAMFYAYTRNSAWAMNLDSTWNHLPRQERRSGRRFLQSSGTHRFCGENSLSS